MNQLPDSATRERLNCYQAAVGDSPLGWIAAVDGPRGLRCVLFGYRTREELLAALRAAAGRDGWMPADMVDDSPMLARLRAFAAGEQDDFLDVPLDVPRRTPFAERVIEQCRRIAPGETASYAELAARAGSSGAARAVGNIMASNRFPLIVPCHRVLGSGGALGGYSAPGGLETKRRLLELERRHAACIGS